MRDFKDNPFNGTPVYRFFDTEEHANSLTKGGVWITTFNRCRRYENEQQGDPGEGFEWYKTSEMIGGHGDDPTFVEYAHRMGIGIGPSVKDVWIGENQAQYVLPDAYMLCMTTRFDPGYFAAAFNLPDTYWCQISDAGRFFHLVTARLNGRYRRTTNAEMDTVSLS